MNRIRSLMTALGLAGAMALGAMGTATAQADLFWPHTNPHEKLVEIAPGEYGTENALLLSKANDEGGELNTELANPAPEYQLNDEEPEGYAAQGHYVYYTVPSGIARLTATGGSPELEFIRLPGTKQNTHHEWEGPVTTFGIAASGEYIYWTTEHAIGRAKTSGAEVTPDFITSPGAGKVSETAIGGGYIFWNSGNTIYRANLNGTEVTAVASGSTGLAANGSYLYFGHAHYISRSNLAGQEVDAEWVTIPPTASYFGITASQGYVYMKVPAASSTLKEGIYRFGANGPGGALGAGSLLIETQVEVELEHALGSSDGLAVTTTPPLQVTVEALNSEGKAWDIADQGVGNALTARVTIANPAEAEETATDVVPATIGVSPGTALTATGPATPQAPAGGWSLAPGQSVSFTEPYSIVEAGKATLTDSVTWHTGTGGSAGPVSGTVTVPLGGAVSGTTFGRECTSTSCKEVRLPEQTILVTGHASDGTAISKLETSNKEGEFEIGVPNGSYRVGPSSSGTAITGEGWTPEESEATVSNNNVGDQDFTVCLADGGGDEAGGLVTEGQLDALAVAARSGDLRIPIAHLASTSECDGSYSFTVEAGIPLAKFVDPSSRAPYAVFSDGRGYRADNEDAKSNWYDKMPDCSKFEYKGEPVKTRPVKWLTYYKGDGSGGLGSVTVKLTWDRYTRDLDEESTGHTDGTLTRVYDYEEDGHAGTCAKREEVVPTVFTSVNHANSTFETMVSWGFPFSPTGASGGESPRIPLVDGLVEKAVESAYDKYVEGGVREGKNELVKTAAVYTITESLVHAGFHLASHATEEAAKKGALAMLTEITEIETKANTAQIIADAIDAYAGSKFGYETMDTVIRGTFDRVECPPRTRVLYCDSTVLAIDASSDRFPQYRLFLSRYGKRLPVASSLAEKIAVVPGADAIKLPEVNPADIKDLYSLPGTAGAEASLERAIKTVRPNALEFSQGVATYGNIPKAFPSCTQKGLPATPNAICFTFLDNRA